MTPEERVEYRKWIRRWKVAIIFLLVVLGVKVYL